MSLPIVNHDDTTWEEFPEPTTEEPTEAKSKFKKAQSKKAKAKAKTKGHKPTKAQLLAAAVVRPAVQATTSISMPVLIGLDKIVIGPNRRKVVEGAKLTIAASMREIGQLEPIIVRKEQVPEGDSGETSTVPVLVDGHHRVLAAKELGWTQIQAVYFHGDAVAAERCEISQTIHRADVTALQRAKWVAKWVELILRETKASEIAQRGGKQPGDKGISKTAEQLGYSRDDTRRFTAIAGMSAEAMAKAEELSPLDDNVSALLKIAKQNPDEQVAMAKQLGVKKKRGKKRSRKPADPKSEKADATTYAAVQMRWTKAPKFQRAFRDATENARRKFIRMLQTIPLSTRKKAKKG
jgi:ParB family transcriptional regulator, chromosome partitioning protein